MHLFEVLRRPVVTEKSTLLADRNKYVFEVLLTANKVQVREAVERVYSVKVQSVNTTRIPGKTKRYGPRSVKERAMKKAVVTLRPGHRIQFFEGA